MTVRLGIAAGVWGAASAAGAADWLAFAAFAIPTIGFALYVAQSARGAAR